jgi:hypothetical protein
MAYTNSYLKEFSLAALAVLELASHSRTQAILVVLKTYHQLIHILRFSSPHMPINFFRLVHSLYTLTGSVLLRF